MKLSLKKFAAGTGIPQQYSLSNMASAYKDRDNFALTYRVTVVFRTTADGSVDVTRQQSPDINDVEQYVDPPFGNLWIRATETGGSHTLNVGDADGTFWSLTASQSRSFGIQYTASSGDPDLANVFVTFELATDAGGSNIVATKSNVELEVGSLGTF